MWGNRIAILTNRSVGAKVTMGLNGQRRISDLAIPLEDEAAGMVLALATTLKVYMDDFMLANVVLTTPSFRGADGKVILTGIDPSFRLERRFLHSKTDYTNTDLGLIMADLIAAATTPPGGIPAGILLHPSFVESSLTWPETRTYEAGQQIWSAVTELSQVLDGPDFELKPVDRTDGVMTEFHVYKRMGTDRSASVVFEFNCGRHNCQDFIYDPSGEVVKNKYTVQGQAQEASTPPTYTSHADAEQEAIGIYEGYESVSDNRPEFLKRKAQEQTSAYAKPPPFFSVTPAVEGKEEVYGTPPEALFDYFLGDTVGAVAKKGYWSFPSPGQPGSGRVTEMTLTEVDAAGNVQVDLVCVPTIQAGSVT